jgi:hypothetical protein
MYTWHMAPRKTASCHDVTAGIEAAVASKKPLATFQVCLWLASTPPLVEPRGLYTPVHAPSSLLYTLPGWHSLTRCSQVAPVLCHGRRHVCSGLTLLPAWYKTSTAQGLARCNNEIGREQWATGVSAPEAQDLESLSTGSCHGLALCATTSTISCTANR